MLRRTLVWLSLILAFWEHVNAARPSEVFRIPGYQKHLNQLRADYHRQSSAEISCVNSMLYIGAFPASHAKPRENVESDVVEAAFRPDKSPFDQEARDWLIRYFDSQVAKYERVPPDEWLNQMTAPMKSLHLTLHEITFAHDFIADEFTKLTRKIDQQFFLDNPAIYKRAIRGTKPLGFWRERDSVRWNLAVVKVLTKILFEEGYSPATFLETISEESLQELISQRVIGFEVHRPEPSSFGEFRHSVSIHPTNLVLVSSFFKSKNPNSSLSDLYALFVNPGFRGRSLKGNEASSWAYSPKVLKKEYYKMFYIKFIEVPHYGIIDGAH